MTPGLTAPAGHLVIGVRLDYWCGMRKTHATFRRFALTAAALASLLAAGCASSDLSKDNKTAARVAEALPTDVPPPTDLAQAVWYPNTNSFSTIQDTQEGQGLGVLAVAGDRLWFLAWNEGEHHYDVLRSVSYLQATGIRIAHLGPASELVVESPNLSFDTFELLNGGRFSSDDAGTRALYAKLLALREKSPPSRD